MFRKGSFVRAVSDGGGCALSAPMVSMDAPRGDLGINNNYNWGAGINLRVWVLVRRSSWSMDGGNRCRAWMAIAIRYSLSGTRT